MRGKIQHYDEQAALKQIHPKKFMKHKQRTAAYTMHCFAGGILSWHGIHGIETQCFLKIF